MRRARIAVVGAGWWASTAHLPALAADPRVELVAVCDPDDARADAAAARFGAQHTATDLEPLLADVDLDGVVIATPHTTHAALGRAALRSGVHVLMEKPLTTAAADAWELVELAERRGLVLSVGVTYLHANTFGRVVRAVREEIGELVAVNGEFSSTTQKLFAVTDDGTAGEDPTAPHGTTYSDPALSGGGQGHTQLTHLLGSMIMATGRQALEVSALMDHRSLRVDLVDALAFRLEGGVLGTASSTGTTAPGVPMRHALRYHGTEGMVEHDILSGRARIHRAGGTRECVEPNPTQAVYGPQAPARAFVRLLLDGGPNPAPGDVGAASTALLDAAYRAATTGVREPVLQGTLRPTRTEHAHAG